MSKTLKLTVDLTFSDEITTDMEVIDIVSNAVIGLKRQAIETFEGLVGGDFNGYTKEIEVNAPLISDGDVYGDVYGETEVL